MPIAQLLELWKKIEVEPMEIEVSGKAEGAFPVSREILTLQPTERVFTMMNSDSPRDGLCQRLRHLTCTDVCPVLYNMHARAGTRVNTVCVYTHTHGTACAVNIFVDTTEWKPKLGLLLQVRVAQPPCLPVSPVGVGFLQQVAETDETRRPRWGLFLKERRQRQCSLTGARSRRGGRG